MKRNRSDALFPGQIPAGHRAQFHLASESMMQNLPRPEVIITHESDLDGLVAGVLLQRLAKRLYGEDVRLEAHHYNSWRQRELRERSGWVTDFTFEARMDRPNW